MVRAISDISFDMKTSIIGVEYGSYMGLIMSEVLY